MADKMKQVTIKWKVQAEGMMSFIVPYSMDKDEVTNLASDQLGDGISFVPKLIGVNGLRFGATAEVVKAEPYPSEEESPLKKLTIVGNPNQSPG